MIKLIASDMDGTLLGSNHDISEENLKAIKAAQDKGIKFAIATGRSYEDVKPFIDKHNLNCQCVALNGGEFRDEKGNLIEGIYIDKEKAKEILEEMQKFNLSIEIYTDDGYYTTNTEEETLSGIVKRMRIFHPVNEIEDIIDQAKRHPHFMKMHYITDLDKFVNSSVKIGKFISFAETVEEINKVKEHMNKIEGLAVSSSFETNIEINDEKATKGSILAKAAEKMNIKVDEVAVFGDGSNDYSMFKNFPNSFAMDNAISLIKDSAKFITVKNSEDGVAKGIYKILEENI